MLLTQDPAVATGHILGNVDETSGWMAPFEGGPKGFVVGLADPETGPIFVLLNAPPGPQLQGPLHHHRSDSFRMNLRNSFSVGRTTYEFGEFRLQAANKVYGPEDFPDDGYLALLIVSDARGMSPIFVDAVDQDRFGGSVPLPERGLPPSGLGASHAEIGARGRLDGSFATDDGWMVLDDGSRAAAYALDDPVSGPVVLTTNNAPGAVESSGGARECETVRVLLRGSCTVGETELGPLDFLVTDAGVDDGRVVHGPEGSSQLLLVVDRRAVRPADADDSTAGRWDDLANLVSAASPSSTAA